MWIMYSKKECENKMENLGQAKTLINDSDPFAGLVKF